MLTVPDAVKGLFKTDGVYKNFRAHFPNGERADITNSDIVRESLSFTESVCSGDVIRFGGCERSVIEFETVGVENILGAVIECGIEIDTTSLTAAQLAAIAADPGDGVLVPAADSDIGRGYYRIPLGTFSVAGCPRNHENVAHRKVTGYSPNKCRLSPIEAAKLQWWSSGDKYRRNGTYIALANLGYYDPGFLTAMGFTRTAATMSGSPTQTSGSLSFTLKDKDGNDVAVSVTYTQNTYTPFRVSNVIKDFGGIDLGDIDAAGLLSFIRNNLEAADIDYGATALAYGFVNVLSDEDFIRLCLGPALPAIIFSDASRTSFCYTIAPLSEGPPVVLTAPPRFDPWTSGITPLFAGKLQVPAAVSVTIGADTFSTGTGSEPPTCWVWTPPVDIPLPDAVIEIPVAEERPYTENGTTRTWRRWDAGDMAGLFRGWMELQGKMLCYGRTGFKTAEISSASPVPLGPGDYSSVWWDEYDVDPVGYVIYAYGTNHDQAGSIRVGTGGSIYDLSANDMLKIASMDVSAIESTIVSGLSLALQNLGSYTPAELVMPAWPWLEAGDCLEITAEDNTVVTTYIMRRTMSGVQMLMDSIEAPGGEMEADDE